MRAAHLRRFPNSNLLLHRHRPPPSTPYAFLPIKRRRKDRPRGDEQANPLDRSTVIASNHRHHCHPHCQRSHIELAQPVPPTTPITSLESSWKTFENCRKTWFAGICQKLLDFCQIAPTESDQTSDATGCQICIPNCMTSPIADDVRYNHLRPN